METEVADAECHENGNDDDQDEDRSSNAQGCLKSEHMNDIIGGFQWRSSYCN